MIFLITGLNGLPMKPFDQQKPLFSELWAYYYIIQVLFEFSIIVSTSFYTNVHEITNNFTSSLFPISSHLFFRTRL